MQLAAHIGVTSIVTMLSVKVFWHIIMPPDTIAMTAILRV
jgi:hypothetical protein